MGERIFKQNIWHIIVNNISSSLLPKDYNYIVKDIEGIKYVAIHHPSYINVYKRNSENEYIKAVLKLMECND